MVRREPRGVLRISIFEKKRRFAESDLKLASKFAEHAASAIDKAGLYEKLREQTKTLKNIIKEMKATQDRFTQPDTLRALSDLTSRMAHDFDNTLATILEKTQLAQKKLEGMPIPEKTKMQDVLEWLRATERLAGDGVETARNVQAFAKTFQVGSEKDSEELDINAIVDETVEATRHRWKDGAELDGIRIKMETHLGELSSPMGNRSDMKDVLTSMIFNSIDALPQGGRICIATRMHRDRVEIKVTDNGVGMSQDVKTKIFEPFFTTKTEEGHGIGLSVAQGIISRQHGDMSVESKPGAGTSFTITLPIKDESTVEPERPAESVNRSEAATPAT
jgi:signal transduction histidine kinase